MQEIPFLQVVGKNCKGFLDGDWILSKDMSDDGEIGIVQLKHIGNGDFLNKDFKLITKKKFIDLRCTPLEEGDLLVSRMAEPICRSCILPELDFPTVTVVDVTIIRPNPDIADIEYLNYILNTKFFQNQAKKYSVGTTRSRISRKNLEKLIIPLPSITTQKRVVSIMNNVKHLREWRKKSDKLTEDYLKSVFFKLFGSPVKNERNWETVTLKEISRFYSGKAWKNEELSDQGAKIVRISNLHKKNFPYWHYAGEIIEKYSVSDGDLLFSWAGVEKSIDVYIYEGEKALLNQHIYNIKIANNEFPKLYIYWILKLFLRYLRSKLGGGVGQFHLKKSTIENIRIINPPLKLKRKFALIAETTEKIRKKQIESKRQIDVLYNVLMQKAFDGELVC